MKLFTPKKIFVLVIFVGLGALGYAFYQKDYMQVFTNSTKQDSVATTSKDQSTETHELTTDEININLDNNAPGYSKPFTPSEGFADLVEYVTPSVVNISAVKIVKSKHLEEKIDGIDPNIKELFKNMMPQQNIPDQKFASLGSGFVVRSDGFIVTNNHVIQDSTNIQVTFPSGKKYKAVIYATDKQTDLALLKIEAVDLPALKFSDSSKARAGDWVIAIGNPFGLGGTVSSGIISATGRDINIGPFNDFIQTDAAINHGNSGGPMINTKGEVLGINTAIISQSGGSIGIGFAVPANAMKNVISQLITNKKVTRSWLGVQVQAIDDNIAKTLDLKNSNGALVSNVVPDSPASKASLQSGDIILAVNDTEITNNRLLPRIISNIKPGTKIKLKILSNKTIKEVEVVLEAASENIGIAGSEATNPDNIGKIKQETYKSLGIKVVDVNDSVRKYFALDKTVNGVIVIATQPNSLGANKFLIPGVRILAVNKENVKNVEHLTSLINKYKSKGLLFFLSNGKNSIFVNISPEELKQGYSNPEQ